MTKPLALLTYKNLLPGSQISNRLLELGYRVQVVAHLEQLGDLAQTEKPILLVAEVDSESPAIAAIAAMKSNPATGHIPVLAFAVDPDKALQTEAMKAGASLLAASNGVLDQLPQLLEQILQIE